LFVESRRLAVGRLGAGLFVALALLSSAHAAPRDEEPRARKASRWSVPSESLPDRGEPADEDPADAGQAPRNARAPRAIAPGRKPFLETEALLAQVMDESVRKDARARRPKASPRAGTILVKKIVLVGGSAISMRTIDRVLAGHEGRRLAASQLRDIAKRVEELYHAHGYLLARVFLPEQEITDGVVKFQVVEGRYGHVVVEGNDFYTERFIRRFFWPARRTDVVSRTRLERALLILNEFPDLQVQSVFKAGREVGTADVYLKVRDERPLHLEFAYDNFGNRFVGENRITLGGLAGSILTEGDRLILRGTQAMPGESDPFIQAEYGFPIDHYGRRFFMQYATASTIVGEELAVLDIRGEAEILTLGVANPLARSTRMTSNLSVAFVGKGVENFLFGTRLQSKDDLRNLVVAYDQSWLDGGGRTLATVAATKGLGDGFGGTRPGDAQASRPGASSEFIKLTADVARVQRYSPHNLFLLRVQGQATTDPLLVPEQFSLGGADSVRGYRQSEFLGDHGYALTLEYRHAFYDDGHWNVTGLFFVDHGYAALENPQRAGQPGGELDAQRLTGAGLGMRGQFGRKTTARVDVGVPLEPSPNADGDDFVVYGQLTTRI
jgi:hemolysin activation/secretion protein